MRLLQSTEVAECPGHLISVSFDVSVFFSFAPNTSAMSRATEGFSAIQTIIRYSFSGTKVIKRGQERNYKQETIT